MLMGCVATGRFSFERFRNGTVVRDVSSIDPGRSHGALRGLFISSLALIAKFTFIEQIILSAVWSNSTLAKLGEAYGLHRALRAAQPQRASLQMNGDVKASLFEARVYGIQLASGEDNYKTIKAFIKELFSPILTAQRAAFAAGDASQAQVMRADNFVDYVSLLNLWSQRFAKRIE